MKREPSAETVRIRKLVAVERLKGRIAIAEANEIKRAEKAAKRLEALGAELAALEAEDIAQ